MSSVLFQKRFMGLTVASEATIAAWGIVGQGTASGQTTDQAKFQTTALSAHNAKRGLYSYSSSRAATLTLAAATDPLNTGSTSYAATLASATPPVLVHSSGAYGENLYIAFNTATVGPDTLATNAVNKWYGEVSSFTYGTEAVEEATFANTGHFTQVVWASTTTLGCGYAIGTYTDTAKTPNVAYNVYVGVCRYTPAGNVQAGDTGTTPYLDNVPMPLPAQVGRLFHFSPLPGRIGPKQTVTVVANSVNPRACSAAISLKSPESLQAILQQCVR
jgi:glioma pathogenesis-related protein 2